MAEDGETIQSIPQQHEPQIVNEPMPFPSSSSPLSSSQKNDDEQSPFKRHDEEEESSPFTRRIVSDKEEMDIDEVVIEEVPALLNGIENVVVTDKTEVIPLEIETKPITLEIESAKKAEPEAITLQT